MDWARYVVIYGPYAAIAATAGGALWLVWLTRKYRSLVPRQLSGWLELSFFLALVFILREGISLFPMALMAWLWWRWFFRKNRILVADSPPTVRTMGEMEGFSRFKIALALVVVVAAQGFQHQLSEYKTSHVDPTVQAFLDLPSPDLRFVRVDDGREHRLSDFKGQVVLLHIWRTSCDPCVKQMRHFDELHARYADEGFAVIHLAPEDAGRIRDHLRQYPTPTIHASLQGIEQAVVPYSLAGMPDTGFGVPLVVILDREGTVRRACSGGPRNYKYFISGVAPYL